MSTVPDDVRPYDAYFSNTAQGIYLHHKNLERYLSVAHISYFGRFLYCAGSKHLLNYLAER
jgi:hypothetical protein